MFPVRAASFTPRAHSDLVQVPDWPRLPGIELDRVVGVAVDSRGFIYAAHRGEHPLLRLRPDGNLDASIGEALLPPSVAYDLRGPTPIPIATRRWMHGLHVDPWDNVWITDVSRHLVLKFSPAGELLTTFGTDRTTGCDATHFYQPTHVCVMPEGDFYVSDGYGNSRIVHFDRNGKFLHEWGRRGTEPGEFHTPHVIVTDRNNRLYVSDRENDRIQVFSPGGEVLAVWSDLHSVDGLCFAPDGFLYASSGIDRAVLRLDLDGRVLDTWVRPDLFNYPHAITVGANGALMVADTGDRWTVTGRLPAERQMEPRTGAEGSALTKLFIR